MFAEIGHELGGFEDGAAASRALTRSAVDRVPGAEHAGVTRGFNGSFHSSAETSELVLRVDEIQYALRSGPCVDAADDGVTIYCSGDLRRDERWPRFGREAYGATGVISMLSLRLFLEDAPDVVAALNMYSTHEAAFGEEATAIGRLLATHGALAISGAAAKQRAHNLHTALTNAREIGVAIGVLMSMHKITRDEAFDLMRLASQDSHRKLSSIATDIADSGSLPDISRSANG